MRIKNFQRVFGVDAAAHILRDCGQRPALDDDDDDDDNECRRALARAR